MSYTIIVQELGKRFHRYHAGRPTTFKGALFRGLRRIRPAESFWALRHVSFSLSSATALGVVGFNGAGKSTLLRLIGGIGRPDEGQVTVRGRIGALFSPSAGFSPELTGRENVFASGIIAGLTRQQVTRRFDAIVAFAELEEFIDSPLRTYSSGMQTRLGFAVAVHTDPEVLLIDEVLSVGDLTFRQKCLGRIARFKDEGCTIVLVSHNIASIQEFCDEALWLRRGEPVAYGPAHLVADQYAADAKARTQQITPATHPVVRTATGAELRVNQNRFGSMEIQIVAVRLLDAAGRPTAVLDSGDPLRVEIEYLAPKPIRAPIFGVAIKREDKTVCYTTNTKAKGIGLPMVKGTGQICLQIERLDLAGGQYYVDVSVYEREWAYAYDHHLFVYPLFIRSTEGQKGILCPPARWEL